MLTGLSAFPLTPLRDDAVDAGGVGKLGSGGSTSATVVLAAPGDRWLPRGLGDGRG